MRLAIRTALAASLLWASAAQAESYLCVADKSAGFYFDKQSKTWDTTTFKAGQKYLVVRGKAEGDSSGAAAWLVKEVGEESAAAVCDRDFNEYGYLHCSGFHEFRMNRKNGRFLMAYFIGYVSAGIVGKEGEDTPNMAIGKCSRIP